MTAAQAFLSFECNPTQNHAVRSEFNLGFRPEIISHHLVKRPWTFEREGIFG
jgi:hypothetical protein